MLRMGRYYRINGKEPTHGRVARLGRVREEGKGRIRILIGMILVARERREGSSKFHERGSLATSFFV